MITIKEVAKEANVAISTVSNTLNRADMVRPETRERVLQAIEKLNYMPNLNGKYLKKIKTKSLGLFITNLEGPFYNDLISAMYAQCCQNNYNLMIYLNGEQNVYESYQAILGKRVDGAIILNNTILQSHIETFQKVKMPVVFLDREMESESMASVVIDNYTGMEQATKYLLETGHTKIGYLHGNADNYDERTRYQGYVETLEKNEIERNTEWEIDGNFAQQSAFEGIKEYIKAEKILPEAFLCANDEMAIGCIEALEQEGWQVPRDISVIGFDNIEKTSYFVPKITTVDSAAKELGKTAVEQLISILKQEPFDKITKISSRLVIRDSCKER